MGLEGSWPILAVRREDSKRPDSSDALRRRSQLGQSSAFVDRPSSGRSARRNRPLVGELNLHSPMRPAIVLTNNLWWPASITV